MGVKYLETLMLHKPTKVSALCDSVPKPKGAVPANGLPMWDKLAVESKLPMMPGLGKKVVFCRAKLGRKLWRSAKEQDFLLQDPYCRQVKYAYEPLHDENLELFFSRAANRKRMREVGLVTAEGAVLCTLREYNEYRRYLHRLHMDAIDRERAVWDAEDRERRALSRAAELADKDREKAVALALRRNKMADWRAEQKAEQQRKLQSCAERLRRHAARVKQLQETREHMKLTLVQRSRALNERLQARRDAADHLQRLRLIATMRMRKEQDDIQRERQRRQKEEVRRQKQMQEEHRWQMKLQTQLNRMDKEKELLYEYAYDEQMRIALRKKLMEDEWLRMDELLNKIKRERQEKQKQLKSDEIAKAITKVLEEQQKISPTPEVSSEWVVEQSVQTAMAETKTQEILTVLRGARGKLQKDGRQPEQVLFATDSLLNSVIKEFLQKQLSSMIAETIEKGVEQVKNKLREPRTEAHVKPRRKSSDADKQRKRSSDIERQKSLLSQGKSSKDHISETRIVREVSFGNAVTIAENYLEGRDGPLLSSRDRPPTPVPSLAALVQEVFTETGSGEEEEEQEDKDSPDYQKVKQEKQLQRLSKLLLKSIVNRVDETELKQKITKPPLPDFKKYEVINKLAQRMLQDDSPITTESKEFNEALDLLVREVVRAYQQQERKSLHK